MTEAERIKKLDEAQAEEAWRIYMFHYNKRPKGADEHRVPAEIAARLAREAATARIKELEAKVAELEGMLTPPEPEPEPVDPDVLAFREWFANRNSPDDRAHILAGYWDSNFAAAYFLAGARAAREQERERAKVLLDYAWEDVGAPGGDEAKARSNRAFDIITKYEKGMR